MTAFSVYASLSVTLRLHAPFPPSGGVVRNGAMNDKYAKAFSSAVSESDEWQTKIKGIIESRATLLSLLRVATEAVGQNRAHGHLMEVVANGSAMGDAVTIQAMGRYATFYHTRPHEVSEARGVGSAAPTVIKNLGIPAEADRDAWCDERISETLAWLGKGA